MEFMLWQITVLAERVRHMERRVERRLMRDAQNPFHLPRGEFIDCFRLTPELVLYITNTLQPDLKGERTSAISPEIKVLVALQFYAQGNYQRSVGNQFHLNISQTSTSRCLHAVTEAVNRHLLRSWVKFPMTNRDRQQARNKFTTAAQPFEGAIGAIDCTFIHILAPREHEEAFLNHHGRHSLNVQAIVDPDLKLLNINARYPGARHDSYIWSTSPIRRAMEFHYNRGERKTWLIGDAGYPLEPWLMTPLANYPEDTQQFQYTEQLCKARNVVERFFGVFKSVWRCLSYQRVLMYEPIFAAKIVNACAVFHNMRIEQRLNDEPFQSPSSIDDSQHEDVDDMDVDNHVIQRGPRVLAQRIQRQIMRERFPNYRNAADDGNEDEN